MVSRSFKLLLSFFIKSTTLGPIGLIVLYVVPALDLTRLFLLLRDILQSTVARESLVMDSE